MDTRDDNFRKLAYSDYLTGLSNRRALYDYYEQLDDRSVIHALFLDIDNFKRVNDVYGHSKGDELLVAVSDLIRTCTNSFTSRIGGDEFVVLFTGEQTDEFLAELARKLLQGMKSLNFRQDILSLTSLSIGIVMNQSATMSLDDILYKCDAAMYEAKQGGKNRYAFYSTADRLAELQHQIEKDKERALANGEFLIYLQPKINMVTTQLIGAEALSRWLHKETELRQPDTYIPLFEKDGFVSSLDLYVFEEVCRIKKSWRKFKYRHIPVSVNMSRLHLFNNDFPDQLTRIAAKYKIPTEELEIEITEGVFIRDSEEMTRMVTSLRQKGFLVSIDDFGSGFSSLNMLQDIDSDAVKLDRNFLKNSFDSLRGRKIIRNIIGMCRDLKVDVITEGVETKEQVNFLLSSGCQYAQGFFYSQPLPLDEFQKFADQYSNDPDAHFSFPLNGSLKCKDKDLYAIVSGGGLEYHLGLFKNSRSVYFPGGPLELNTLHLPIETMVSDSFTISMWIRPKQNHRWTSALYIKFETGFLSVNPMGNSEGLSTTRIRDSREVDGWYDLPALLMSENIWTHYVVTYNARNEKVISFINGEVVYSLENVPANRLVKWIILGGDVFQQSFNGCICEVQIYNECKDYDFVYNLHDSYRRRKGFIAFEPGAHDWDKSYGEVT